MGLVYVGPLAEDLPPPPIAPAPGPSLGTIAKYVGLVFLGFWVIDLGSKPPLPRLRRRKADLEGYYV